MKIEREISKISKNGISCHTRSYFPDKHWFHWHEKYEICQIINRSCSFRADGMLIDADPGDIIVFKERCIHCFLIDKEDTLIRILQFPVQILLSARVSITPICSHIPLKDMENIPRLLFKINTLFDLLEQECSDNKHRDSPFLFSLSSSLYFLLMQYFPEKKEESKFTKEQIEFYEIVQYINDHFLEDININTLSEKLFLPRGRLSTIFVKYSGINLNEYINSLRVQNVNKLLDQGFAITEAAMESGFQSIRTFNNVYKKVSGITPSDYARK